MKKVNLWRGLASTMAFLLVFSIFGTSIATSYTTSINTFLGTSTTQIVELDPDVVEDTEYYKSEYGELSRANLQLLIQDAYAHAVTEMEEGAVLLRNENNTLPLAENERSVTLFGHAVVQPLYRTNASGSNAAKTGTYVIDLYGALSENGFSINDELYKAYQNSSTTRTPEAAGWNESKEAVEALGEEDIGFYTEALQESWSADYNDVAIVMFAREGGEDVDMKMSNSDGISALALQQEEKDLLTMIRDSGKFSKTVVLVNSPYQMELGWLEEFGVDACLWIGAPGQRGFEARVRQEKGKLGKREMGKR